MGSPRVSAIWCLIVARSRQPASWSYITKSAPAAARICGRPGDANSITIGPNTASPRSSLARSGLARTAALLLLDVPHDRNRHFQEPGQRRAVRARLEELPERHHGHE